MDDYRIKTVKEIKELADMLVSKKPRSEKEVFIPSTNPYYNMIPQKIFEIFETDLLKQFLMIGRLMKDNPNVKMKDFPTYKCHIPTNLFSEWLKFTGDVMIFCGKVVYDVQISSNFKLIYEFIIQELNRDKNSPHRVTIIDQNITNETVEFTIRITGENMSE